MKTLAILLILATTAIAKPPQAPPLREGLPQAPLVHEVSSRSVAPAIDPLPPIAFKFTAADFAPIPRPDDVWKQGIDQWQSQKLNACNCPCSATGGCRCDPNSACAKGLCGVLNPIIAKKDFDRGPIDGVNVNKPGPNGELVVQRTPAARSVPRQQPFRGSVSYGYYRDHDCPHPECGLEQTTQRGPAPNRGHWHICPSNAAHAYQVQWWH